jgi:hypothetical protein
MAKRAGGLSISVARKATDDAQQGHRDDDVSGPVPGEFGQSAEPECEARDGGKGTPVTGRRDGSRKDAHCKLKQPSENTGA